MLEPLPWRIVLGLAACAAASACTTATETGPGGLPPTEIRILPSSFLGTTPCADVPGAMRSYVATVTDTTAGFVLPSSPPIACSQEASFRLIDVGHSYSGEIDAYDVDADKLLPLGGASSGSPHLVDRSTNQRVPPKWQTTCPAATAIVNSPVYLDCKPLPQGQGANPTGSVLVDPNRTLDGLTCIANNKGDVATFDVLQAGTLLFKGGLQCGKPLDCLPSPGPTCFQNLDAGTLETYRIEAHDASGAVRWGAECSAIVQSGLTITATCDSLSDLGAIAIDVQGVMAASGLKCGKDATSIGTYDACSPSCGMPGITSNVRPCGTNLRLEPIPAGDNYHVELDLTANNGTRYVSECTNVSVPPGSVVQAACTNAVAQPK